MDERIESNSQFKKGASEAYAEALINAEHNNGRESALNQSKFPDIVFRFNEATHGNVRLCENRVPKIKELLDVGPAMTKPKKNGTSANVKTGLYTAEKNNDSGKIEPVALTVKRLYDLWENTNYTLSHEWATPIQFIAEVHGATKLYRGLVSCHRAERMQHNDAASELLRGDTIVRNTVALGDACLKPTINAYDKEFLYDNLRTRNGELYWSSPTGGVTPIFKDDKTNAIHQTSQFLDTWEQEAYPLLKQYRETIMLAAQYTIDDREKDEATGYLLTLTDRIQDQIPRIVLENAYVSIRKRAEDSVNEDGSGKKELKNDGVDVGVGKGDLATNWSMSKWREIFIKNALKSIRKTEVAPIKLFGNVQGESIVYFPLDGIHIQGDIYEKRPELPRNWNRFLFGKDGKTPIFACDIEMSLLRIAYFVSQLVLENGYTRQILIIAGKGDDGKSVFNNVLTEMIGRDYCYPVNPEKLSDDSALQGIVNKILISMPELQKPSAIYSCPAIKQITGRDTMYVRRLYCSPFAYTPEHVFLMATTNKKTYVKGNYAVTRLLPLTFQQNYDTKTQISDVMLTAMLLEEKQEFLQWCFDMIRYYKDKKNAAGESTLMFKPNGITLYTDEQYAAWLAKDTPMTDEELKTSKQREQQQIVEAINNCGNKFEAMLDEDAEENDAEFFSGLINEYFKRGDGTFTGRAELQEYVLKHGGDIKFRVCGFNLNNLNYCPRYRCFLNYIRSLDGVEECKKRLNGANVRGFSGIALIESASDDKWAIVTKTEKDNFEGGGMM